ncbi:MAG TPA: hypothetical protein V6C71_08355 [Coleofasciculaceae cyanobacterium]|jgi:hypothetical protein
MVKAKPNQKIHVNKLTTVLDKLDQLESKPVEELTLRESIYFLRGKLNSALKKGYSYEDLSSILAEQEILVSAATLKLYLTENSKSKNKKSSSRRTQSKSSSKSTSVLSTNVTDSKEELGTGNSDAGINRMKENMDSEQAVNLNPLNQTKSSRNMGKKVSANNQAIAKGSKNVTKPRVLSGFDDDLSGDFNDY